MRKYNIMIGPNLSGAGGISSVVNQYQRSGFFSDLNIVFWSSWQAGSPSNKAISVLKLALKLFGWLLVGKIGLLHVHSATNISFLRKSIFSFLAILFGVPVIFHIHSGKFFHDYKARSLIYKKWVELILNRSAAVIVLSKTWGDEAASILKQRDTIHIIPNPIGLTLPSDFKRIPRRPKKLRLLFLGGLTEAKGFYDLIITMFLLQKKQLDIELRCGGAGNLDHTKALLEKYQLTNSVVLLGWIDSAQKIKEFEEADAFVLPSYFEGQPMSILEAMQAEVLVISTFAGGIPDVINHEHNGLLVMPGDVAALESQIVQIYENSSRGNNMVIKAKEYVLTTHAPEVILAKLQDIYRKV